jgi:tRNA threonylcarbamoyladenosine biosynthesis protein TsaB
VEILKILAIDTSGKVISVALCENDMVLSHFFLNYKISHSETLMPILKNLLETVGVEIDEIHLFAVSSGPGSFTGIRIGVSTFKAFSYALNKPLLAVNTLEALAYNVTPDTKKVCPIIDARNQQVFTGVFRPIAGKYVLEGAVFPIEMKNYLVRLKQEHEEVVFTGDAVDLHKDYILEVLGERAFFSPRSYTLPSAVNVAYVATLYYQEGKIENGLSAVPFYLRKSGAELELERKKRLGL